jgi:hypothetical protein
MSARFITVEMLDAAFKKIMEEGGKPHIEVISLREWERRYGKVGSDE